MELPVQCVALMCAYVNCVCVCKCLCGRCVFIYPCSSPSRGSGCVSWRRRTASSEVDPAEWGPGSCVWSWSVKVGYRSKFREILSTETCPPFPFYSSTRLTVISSWLLTTHAYETSRWDLESNPHNSTKRFLCSASWMKAHCKKRLKMNR